MQADRITSVMVNFGGKLYLEFGGKLLDDNHLLASSLVCSSCKAQMLQLTHGAEVVFTINTLFY